MAKGKKKSKPQQSENVSDITTQLENSTVKDESNNKPIDEYAELDAMWSDDEKPKKKKNNKQKEIEQKKSDDENDDNNSIEGGSTVKTAAQKKKEKKLRQKQKQKEAAASQNNTKPAENVYNEKKDAVENTGEIERLEKKQKLTKKDKMKLEMLKRIRSEAEARREEERIAQKKFDDEQAIILANLEKQRLEKEREEQRKIDKKKRREQKKIEDKAKGLPTTKKEIAAAKKREEFLKRMGIQKGDNGLTSNQKVELEKEEESEYEFETVDEVVEVDEEYSTEEEVTATEESELSDEWDIIDPDDLKTEKKMKKVRVKKTRKTQKTIQKQIKVKVVKTQPTSPEPPLQNATIPESSSKKVSQATINSNIKVDVKEIPDLKGRSILENVKDDPEWADLDPLERVENRLLKRAKLARKNLNLSVLRSPVICVLGHVDTGKTKILDNLRKTNVQDGEAGGITQQIGATNVNIETVKERTWFVDDLKQINIPGLLIIDTPGHESFANLRTRGSSLCDMAILVVDIMHGIEPQTLDSINLLLKGKTPFVIALNKIDRLYEWKSNPNTDIKTVLESQNERTKQDFEKRWNHVFADFAAKASLNVELFWKNQDSGIDAKEHYLNVIPTSAHTGDGMGNLMAMVVKICQEHLTKRIAFSEKTICNVLEVKSVVGHGTCIDCILTQGRLRFGDEVIISGSNGAIQTQIKGLIMPQADRDLRVKTNTEIVKQVSAANGVRITTRDPLDKALAGTTLHVVYNNCPDEIEYYKKEAQVEIDRALKAIKVDKTGVYVQASTLGALEALVTFLREKKVPIFAVNVGPIHKKDVIRASTMLEHDPRWALILAFDVKMERDAETYAKENNIKIYRADIIYHLFDHIENYMKEYIEKKREETKHLAKFPCELEILPQHVIRTRDPIIIGVKVINGKLKAGATLVALNKDYGQVIVGDVSSIEHNNTVVDMAKSGEEICIKIDGAQGEAPKLLGRHFEVEDRLVSKIRRENIDVLKEWWRDDLSAKDWKLVKRLKNLYNIL